ncbi:MAG: ribonuclease HIII [Verrucomicrobiota bacterium]
MTCHTATLTPEQSGRLEEHLRSGGYRLREVPHARVSGVKPDLNVTLYQSGKLVAQGKGTREFVEFVLEPEILGAARIGYEAVLDPSLMEPRIGVDESGKGDFFGPLCVAAVYVNAAVLEAWKSAGIRDSKTVGSDAAIARLDAVIRGTPGCQVSVIAIGNEAYNRLHERHGSVNTVLAWGHARAIENLLERGPLLDPPPVRAVSDQFASSKTTVERALLPLGRSLPLVQRHRAEEDIAVAAASIVARHECLERLGRLGKEFGMTLPRGASAAVEHAARALVASHGAGVLPRVAKMHFRTRHRVLGEPEPPSTPWRPGGRKGP